MVFHIANLIKFFTIGSGFFMWVCKRTLSHTQFDTCYILNKNNVYFVYLFSPLFAKFQHGWVNTKELNYCTRHMLDNFHVKIHHLPCYIRLLSCYIRLLSCYIHPLSCYILLYFFNILQILVIFCWVTTWMVVTIKWYVLFKAT